MTTIRRNMTCIKCGTARTASSSPSSVSHPLSPRFINSFNTPDERQLSQTLNMGPRLPTPSSSSSVVSSNEFKNTSKPSVPCYPLLTPSGKALSAGGRVRNISTDPLAPCIMYWPDNEPLPDKGQIRPLGSSVMQVRMHHYLASRFSC